MTKQEVGVVGIGQTKFRSKRRDVNIPEMIYEAVKMAFDDAQLEPKDIDAIIIGNILVCHNNFCSKFFGNFLHRINSQE